MKASDLKRIVGLLAPSLGSSDILPALSHFCFSDTGCYTFDDAVATWHKLNHGLDSFGVEGRELSGLLSTWGDKELELTTTKENDVLRLIITHGRSTTKLLALKRSALLFDQPEIVKGSSIRITSTERLKEVMDCVATSAANPIYKGVTLSVKAGSNTVMAYSTSGMTMIHAKIGSTLVSSGEDRGWVLPKLAVQQMLSLFASGGHGEIGVQLSRLAMLAKLGQTSSVFAKLLGDAAIDFVGPLRGDSLFELEDWKTNDALYDALGTACTVYQTQDHGICKFTIGNGELAINVKNKRNGEFDDTVPIKYIKTGDEKTMEFYTDPHFLHAAFAYASIPDNAKCVVKQRAMLFGDPNLFMYAAGFAAKKVESSVGEE